MPATWVQFRVQVIRALSPKNWSKWNVSDVRDALGKINGCQLPEGAMRTRLIVITTPEFKDCSCVVQAGEPMSIQTLVSQFTIETLDIAIVGRFAPGDRYTAGDSYHWHNVIALISTWSAVIASGIVELSITQCPINSDLPYRKCTSGPAKGTGGRSKQKK